jgi:8-oxo-dGTP diphosphatase
MFLKLLNKAVKAIIKNDLGQILILKRTPLYKRKGFINVKQKYAKLDVKNIWDLPGGRLFLNEDIKKALKREVLEETSLDIRIIKDIGKKWSFIALDNKKIIVTNFSCSLKNKEDQNKIILSEEHEEYKWVSLKDLNKYKFKDKSIFDALV